MLSWRFIVFWILAFTALCKLLGLMWPSKLWMVRDELIHVPIFFLVATASIVEIVLCYFILTRKAQVGLYCAVFGFSATILGYRLMAYMNEVKRCPCLGNVADWWPWLGQHEGPILTTISLWLFLTSAMQLISASPGLGSERIQVCER